MANIANKADDFDEIQLAISALEYARELAGGIGSRNENLLIDLKQKLDSYEEYKSQKLIEKRMENGRLELMRARSKNLEIGQSLPEVEELLGKPHEKILGSNGTNPEHNFLLIKIEKL